MVLFILFGNSSLQTLPSLLVAACIVTALEEQRLAKRFSWPKEHKWLATVKWPLEGVVGWLVRQEMQDPSILMLCSILQGQTPSKCIYSFFGLLLLFMGPTMGSRGLLAVLAS